MFFQYGGHTFESTVTLSLSVGSRSIQRPHAHLVTADSDDLEQNGSSQLFTINRC